MDKTENLTTKESIDFAFETTHLLKLNKLITKEAARTKLWRIKKKLDKPKNGILLASEFCELTGLNLNQLSKIVL